MMKKIGLAFGIGLLAACGSPTPGTHTAINNDSLFVSGSLEGLDSGYVILRTAKDNDLKLLDSMPVRGGRFEGKLALREVTRLVIEANDQQLVFAAKPGEMMVTGKADSIAHAIVHGNAIPADEADYTSKTKHYKDSIDMLYSQSDTFTNLTPALVIEANRNHLQRVQKKLATADSLFIAENPESFVSANLLYDKYMFEPEAGPLNEQYALLSDTVKSGYYGKRLFKLVELARKLDIGQPAPDFTLPDVGGKPTALSSFKGNYTLVDFWASWCGPCRAENPAVVAAYNKFKGKGFQILGVSLDTDRKAWENAIKKDRLAWKQVSDLKGWETEVCATYGVMGIPTNFLLDKEGKIVAKSLRGPALFKKLSEIYH